MGGYCEREEVGRGRGRGRKREKEKEKEKKGGMGERKTDIRNHDFSIIERLNIK